jgi:hypothetical protein
LYEIKYLKLIFEVKIRQPHAFFPPHAFKFLERAADTVITVTIRLPYFQYYFSRDVNTGAVAVFSFNIAALK